MLASHEEDVVAKACAAIYRFSEKCKNIYALDLFMSVHSELGFSYMIGCSEM